MGTPTNRFLVFPQKERQALDLAFQEAYNQHISKDVQAVKGDMIYASAARTPTRLAIGSANQLLGVDSGIPTWKAQSYIDHGSLTGLADDDHTQYLLASAATDRATFATNWTDLTDSGATTLHKHDHGGMDGLGDDDHTQYILVSGTRAFSGNARLGSNWLGNDGGNEGIQFDTSGNATLSGKVTQSGQPCFLVTDGTGATDVTGDNTTYQMTWPTEVYDIGGNFASGIFTAPIAGKYYFSASVQFENILVTHTNRIISITTSNRQYRWLFNQSLAATSQSMHVCCIADMDANDIAIVEVRVAGSTKTVDIAADATVNTFSGSLIN